MKVDEYLFPAPLSTVPDQVKRAVDLGYDGIFSADTAHDPFFPLLIAAEQAPAADLGTAIAVAFARSPMTVAQTSWDLAEVSGGRFLLGLGTQIRPHITRRFSMPWDSPGPRMREFIESLRAIWDTWQNGTRLSFRGDFYQFTLMTPFFTPPPVKHPDIPIYIAGVGPYMCKLAGEICQGFHVHPMHTIRYLDEVVLPGIAEGAAAHGRTVDDVEMVSTVMVVTGHDEEEMAAAASAAKAQISFYASTPAYAGVLDLHGWDFGPTLNAMSKRGEWAQMASVIPDEVVNEVAVVAPLDELAGALRAKYGDRLQRVGFYAMAGANWTDDELAELIRATKK